MLFFNILTLYSLVGLAFGLDFLFSGYKRLLPAADGTPFFIRIVWVPAAIALWPYLIVKWVQAKT